MKLKDYLTEKEKWVKNIDQFYKELKKSWKPNIYVAVGTKGGYGGYVDVTGKTFEETKKKLQQRLESHDVDRVMFQTHTHRVVLKN